MARAIGHIAAKENAERRFPHKVEIGVPPDQFDVRVREMVAWCWQRAEPGAWEQHSRNGLSRRGAGGLSLDVVRFYFMDARVAEAFSGRWEQRNRR